MARPFNLNIAESAEYLAKSLKRARSASQKERLQMLWWIKTGQITQRQDLNKRLSRSPATLTRWVSIYRNGGLKALLEEKKAPGAVAKIQGEALDKLKQQLASEGGFSSYQAIVEWLKQACGLEVKYATVYHTVRYHLQAKLKVPRPVSLKQKPKAIETFKQNFRLTLMELQAILGIDKLRYLAQDESRIGRKTETKRVITAKGVKPKAQVEWPREAFWLYGIVEPSSGWVWTQLHERLNSETFQRFINDLSQELGTTVAVMQLDQAPAHTAHAIEWPENIIPIFQPSHCPELNGIERLWQHLKGQWKGETFPSLKALRQRVKQELSNLSVERVQSLTSFNFILDALLHAAFKDDSFCSASL